MGFKVTYTNGRDYEVEAVSCSLNEKTGYWIFRDDEGNCVRVISAPVVVSVELAGESTKSKLVVVP